MHLPRFGMGCSALGNLYRPTDDATAIEAVQCAIDQGLSYFDVAPHYGFGLAERRLGAALKRADRSAVTLSTKVGRLLVATAETGVRHGFVEADPFEPVFDYSYEGVLESHRQSLSRMGVSRIDILLAHDLGCETHAADAALHEASFVNGGYLAMRELKRAGEISLIGVGVNEVAICERLLDRLTLDVILLAGRYTLLEQGALALLDRCAALGVRVIVGGPFNSGLLVESKATARHYNYGLAPSALVERADRLAQTCATHGVALPAAALAFPFGHPAVACVLPGFATPAQVEQFATWRDSNIPSSLWEALKTDGLLAAEIPVPA